MSNSSSVVQREAESTIVEMLESKLNIKLERNKKFRFERESLVVDYYSHSHCIIGEIYSHVGKLKSAQIDKIKRDILKMLYLERKSQINYTKQIVVNNLETYTHLKNNSWLSDCFTVFGIDLVLVELPNRIIDQIITVQKLQDLRY